MVKFSPVLLASLFAYNNAFNVDTFIDEAMKQIYSETVEGTTKVQKISLQPYLDATIKSEPNGNFDASGSYGNGEPIEFTETFTQTAQGFTFTRSDKGNYDNSIWVYFWPQVAGMEFDSSFDVEVNMAEMSFAYNAECNIEGHSAVLQENVALQSMQQSRRGMAVELAASGSNEYDIWFEQNDLAWLPAFEYDVIITGKVSSTCMQRSPFHAGCSASLAIAGTKDSENINWSVTHTAAASAFTIAVNVDDNEIFNVVFDHSTDLLKVTGTCAEYGEKHLVSLPLPQRFGQIEAAFNDYVAPFGTYTKGAMMANDPMVAVVWVDQAFNTMSDEFDCSGIVEATGFESEALAEGLGVESMQDAMKGACSQFNDIAVSTIQGLGGELASARDYVWKLCDPAVG